MIEIVIGTQQGAIVFKDEIESFDWSLRNPEGMKYQVSMPTIIANLVVHSIDNELYNIRRGDRATVWNAKGVEKLNMVVISATVLEDKGKTEVAFEGMPVPENKLGRGVFSLNRDYLDLSVYSDTIEIRSPRELVRGHAIIRQPEDYLLSYLWGNRLSKLSIAPSEFLDATPEKDYVIFDRDLENVPEVWLSPDNIVSFDISPAQPPITAIRTPQRVESEYESIITPIEGADMAKGFFIEGDRSVRAVYASGTDDLSFQYLIWDDGHVLDLGTTHVNVVGIFTDSYVEAELSLYYDAVLRKKDKYTGEIIGSSVQLNGFYNYFEMPGGYSGEFVNPTITTYDGGLETIWFNTLLQGYTSQSYVGLTSDMNLVSIDSTGMNVDPDAVYYFAGTYKNSPAQSRTVTYVSNPHNTGKVQYMKIQQIFSRWSELVEAVDLDESFPAAHVAEVVDVFDNAERYSQNSISIIYRYHALNEYKIKTFEVLIADGAIVSTNDLEGIFEYLDSGDRSVLHSSNAPLVQLEQAQDGSEEGHLYVLDNIVNRKVISEIDKGVFNRLNNRIQTRYRNNFVGAFYSPKVGDDKYVIIMLNEVIPWSQRKVSNLDNTYRLSQGVENILDVPFIISDTIISGVDTRERGRVTLDIASFGYSSSLSGTGTAIVQDLDMPALMSYVRFLTKSDGVERWMIVTGIDIEYRGVVRMRLHGIII